MSHSHCKRGHKTPPGSRYKNSTCKKCCKILMRKWHKSHRKETRASKRALTIRIKHEVLLHYSKNSKRPQCSHQGCKISDLDMLCLDHVGNNGRSDRNKKKCTGSTDFYSKLKSLHYPKGYQTLCANHNIKKEIQKRKKEQL